jgi:alpha-L-fucosidase
VKWVQQFQPECFVGFNHGAPAGELALRERGEAGAVGDAGATRYNKEGESHYEGYRVAEFTYPILPEHEGGADWFYSLPEHDSLCHTPEKIFADYVAAARHGNLFSLNVGPDYEGRLRAVDVQTLRAVGEKVRAWKDGQGK